MRISIRGFRPVNSSFATRSEKLQFVPSNRPRLGVNALEPLPSYIGSRDEPRASVDRASSRARVRDPRISRDRLDVEDARRDSLRPRARVARVPDASAFRAVPSPRLQSAPVGSLTRRARFPRATWAAATPSRGRAYPTHARDQRLATALAYRARQRELPSPRSTLGSRDGGAQHRQGCVPRALLHRRAPGRVRRPRQRLLPLPRRVPARPLRACAPARGPRRARVDLDHDPRRRFWAPTGPLRLRGKPRGGVPRVAPHHSRLDPRRDAHARRGGFQHLLHRPLRPRRSAARPVDLEPIGVGSARGVVRAHATRRGRGSRRIARRSRAVSTRAPTRDRPIDRPSTRRDRARPATGRRTSMANGSDGDTRRNRTNRVSDTNRRREVARERVDGEAAPRRERAEAGYYPASYRVALSSGGRDTTASCALRAASRRAESPTVRAVPLRAGRPPMIVAPMSVKMRLARAKLAELEVPGAARRARRGSDARDDAELRVLVPRCANERRATGTSRPTSHLPERFGAGFGGAARRWAR